MRKILTDLYVRAASTYEETRLVSVVGSRNLGRNQLRGTLQTSRRSSLVGMNAHYRTNRDGSRGGKSRLAETRRDASFLSRRDDDRRTENGVTCRERTRGRATRSREERGGTRARVYKLVECSRCTTAPKPPRTTAGLLSLLLLLAVLRDPTSPPAVAASPTTATLTP